MTTRYFVGLQAEIAILDIDLRDEDYDAAGVQPEECLTAEDMDEVVCQAAYRILGPVGVDVQDAEVLGSDER